MKCHSAECLWSATPPPHRITETAVLNQPPTLYTGGSDGSIIWWKLGSPSNQDVWPMAMLCGHAASIAGLDICVPRVDHGEIESIDIKTTSVGSEALMSACTDGVLCIWTSRSGYCRRRRKLPPWVGSPTAMLSLPVSRRYVCVACSYVDAVSVPNYSTAGIPEARNVDHFQNETVNEREIASRRTSKGAVVIVDSCTLNIVRTVFHGSFSIGPVKSMALVVSLEGRKDQSVILADALGRVQLFAILKKCDPEGDGGSGPVKSSPCNGETSNWAEILHDGIQGISVAPHGRLLVFIFRSHCTFKTSSGDTVGEISLINSSLLKESSQAYLIGGMFLEIENVTDALDVQDMMKGSIENFVMWSNTGAALIISISRSLDSFNFEPLCEIPSVSHAPNVKICISFCQLSSYLLRIESICSEVEHPLLWKPRISIWSISHPPVLQSDIQNKLVKQSDARENSNDHVDPHFSIMLGESGFLGDWTWSSNCFPKSEGGLRHTACPKSKKEDTGKNSRKSCFPATNLNDYCGERGDDLVLKERMVSSSMVLSEDSYAPYAVAYGFCSGEIIVVKLEMFVQENVVDASLNHGIDLHASDIIFSGHTGAILCLAAHRMVATLGQQKFKHVLLSGSMDCTVRIWDLGSGELVSVMHHHLAPVRQIILPPLWTDHPWDDCFLSVGEDACVALASLETLRVERIFPGHPSYPRMVVWDSARGYIACLCRKLSSLNDEVDVLYLWDVKTGARERVIRGAASHSMFDHFCKGINVNVITGNILGGTTSASSLFLHAFEDASFSHDAKNLENINVLYTGGKSQRRIAEFTELNGSLAPNSKEKLLMSKSAHDLTRQVPLDPVLQSKKHPIKCSCPFPGVATLRFDLSSLMAPISGDTLLRQNDDKEQDKLNVAHKSSNKSTSEVKETLINIIEQPTWVLTLDGCLLRFGLSFLHIWGIDHELDRLLVDEMGICRPEKFLVSAGHVGDRGSLTLMFPGLHATLELWRSSSEFCAIRSLTMVSLAQRMIGLSHSTSAASSALAAFYTRNFAERVPDIQPPLLQLLVSFWKDPSEHVRMAARSLFHCAASRAIPLPICSQKTTRHAIDSSIVNCEGTDVNSDTGESSPNSLLNLDGVTEKQENHQAEESEILTWLESYDVQDWICCIGGTNQDAKASHIVVAGALAVWYPSLVKPTLATSVAHHLVKLVMALTDKYSATAAELLAEGMESTWKACIGPEIPHMVGDIFLLIECLSSTSANTTVHNTVMAVTIRDILVGALLPSLAMGDITGFLSIVESQIWATASDSPVHVVSLMTLIRVVRSSPKPLAPHLDKVVNFILQTMDHGNSVMRKACLNSSLTALREAARVFPMVALNEASTRLAVGDAIGDIHNLSIQVYDIQSVTKIKVLDASGPPGLPSFLAGELDGTITTAISALSFSPDGEGLVAFSEHGLMIRWWSLGSAWWEKLSSRSIVPVQCTKLILVPPWEGFSPNTSRSSIMASIIGNGSQTNTQERTRGLADADRLKLLIHNLDLSYRLEWVAGRKLVLKRQGQELGSFQL